MSLDQFRTKKSQLESQILELIKDFEVEHGVTVSYIGTETAVTMGSTEKTHNVIVEVKL